MPEHRFQMAELGFQTPERPFQTPEHHFQTPELPLQMPELPLQMPELPFQIFFIFYLALPTRAGSPQQHMPITVGPFYLTHPVNFPCGRKPEYPGKTHDFRQSVDFYSFRMRTGFESH
jgi:hypothetical protein